MAASHSLGLAHIEHVSSRTDSRRDQSPSLPRRDVISTKSNASEVEIDIYQALNDTSNTPQDDEGNASTGRASHQFLPTSTREGSTATSYLEPDRPDTVTRTSSRSLLPHPDPVLDDREEADIGLHVLEPQLSGHRGSMHLTRSISRTSAQAEHDVPPARAFQGKPNEFPNLLAEATCVLVCAMGQLLFSIFIGNIRVNLLRLTPVLRIAPSQVPWLDGAYLLANGLSVIIFGSLADLAAPREMVVGAFGWLTVWNIVGAFALSPEKKVLFFVVRAMQGLAVGVLVSTSMSILGRIYNPGMRKTRVFSAMAAGSPFGFWIGALQGGALSEHLPWIFGSTALLCGALCAAAWATIPKLKPAKDASTGIAPSLKNFDYLGAGAAATGCACILFGLTQGSSARWTPYTYSLVVVGFMFLGAFAFIERKVTRPLIPNGLWKIPGFAALAIAYFMGFGSFVGAWQLYAVQFWLRIQHASPMDCALYMTPNAVAGVLATWVVSLSLHKFPGHWILTVSMLAYALAPVFFLPQTPNTSYYTLSLPGIFLSTFGPDMSFAACSVFITSNVPRSYQGSAGSVLVTIQNVSSAMVASLADTIGVEVDAGPTGEIGLEGLRATWWFAFTLAMLAALVTSVGVRMPKTEEKEHAT